MKDFFENLECKFDKFMEFRRLSPMEKRIKVAEADMLAAYTRWKSLLAAQEAQNKSREEMANLVKDTYKGHGYDLTFQEMRVK